jgi:NAD-dependent SIR2 family protein deacetylase
VGLLFFVGVKALWYNQRMYERVGEESIEESVGPLAEALEGARRLVALTGAGISTESGIPDYRSASGLWTRHTPIYYADYVRNPAVRRRYWARGLNGYSRFRNAKPNAGHRAIAAMEAAGRLHWLVTQNVDGLHRQAGSRRMTELHGENSTVQCIECGHREPRTETQARLEWENRHLRLPADETGEAEGIVVPVCTCCGGLIKPAVVFFGESVPGEYVAEATRAVSECDALLVVGSSLTVWSGYRLARQAREEGKPVCILNIGPTRADGEATVKVEAPAGAGLEYVARRLGAALGE